MIYESKQDIIEELKRQYKEEGILLSIKRSSASGVRLKCDLGGSCKAVEQEQQPKRKSSSRLTGCEFEISCGVKKGKWFVKSRIGEHNHPLDRPLNGHPGFRRLDDDCKQRIRIMHESGIQPKHILTNIKLEFPSATCTIQEIYNAISELRKEYLNGRTQVEALLDLT